MKLSGKILLIALIVLVGLIIALTASARIMIGRIGAVNTSEAVKEYDMEWKEMELSIDNITELKIHGVWDVELTQSSTPYCKVEYSAYLEDYIVVNDEGDTLFLDLRKGTTMTTKSHIHAEIGLPDLEKASLRGAGQLKFSGFSLDNLVIQNEGVSNIEGKDNRITDLSVTSDGTGNIDLLGSSIVNADVDVEGVSRIALGMNGGVLTGNADGLVVVEYSGPVSKENVRTNGLAKVVEN